MTTSNAQPVPRVVSIQTGRVAPLGPEGVPSAFVKSGVSAPIRVAALGLDGDEQADHSVHGGLDKAVYCYPSEHYARWLHDVPHHRATLAPGAFGENLTTAGLVEDRVAIGDVLQIGTAEVQVTQPRQPCFKLGLRFSDNSLGRIMMQTGRTGWYLRVLKPGVLQAGDAIATLHRSSHKWTIARFNSFVLRGRADREQLEELATLETLAAVWRDEIRAAIDREPPR